MSATGRGAVRRAADFYPTPAACTLALLRAVNLPGGDWLEPSAGEGGIIRAINSVRSDVSWTAVELRPEGASAARDVAPRTEIAVGDFLAIDFSPARFQVAILNPPFSEALPFILKCLDVADWVVCLQRLNYLGPANRNPFWREHMPDVYVLSTRPSFTGDGTDMTEYCWMVWPPDGHSRAAGRIEVLDAAPTQGKLAIA